MKCTASRLIIPCAEKNLAQASPHSVVYDYRRGNGVFLYADRRKEILCRARIAIIFKSGTISRTLLTACCPIMKEV